MDIVKPSILWSLFIFQRLYGYGRIEEEDSDGGVREIRDCFVEDLWFEYNNRCALLFLQK